MPLSPWNLWIMEFPPPVVIFNGSFLQFVHKLIEVGRTALVLALRFRNVNVGSLTTIHSLGKADDTPSAGSWPGSVMTADRW